MGHDMVVGMAHRKGTSGPLCKRHFTFAKKEGITGRGLVQGRRENTSLQGMAICVGGGGRRRKWRKDSIFFIS